jgi:hypothetical protein
MLNSALNYVRKIVSGGILFDEHSGRLYVAMNKFEKKTFINNFLHTANLKYYAIAVIDFSELSVTRAVFGLEHKSVCVQSVK